MNARFVSRVAALALGAITTLASAQSLADLRNDAATPGDVTTYGMGWSQQRFSPLKQINVGNAGKLQALWNLSLDNSANASSQPLVIDGTMYVASHTHTMAVDALTGRIKWKTIHTIVEAGYIDAFRACHPADPGMTMPSWDPHVRLDYVFVPQAYRDRIAAIDVVRDPRASSASDHLPVVADLTIR